jgi:monoterpene epsilon-lactone hydrolase
MNRNYVSAAAIGAALTISLASGRALSDDTTPAKPLDQEEVGIARVPSFEIPLSRYMSKEAKAVTVGMMKFYSKPAPEMRTIAEARAYQDLMFSSTLKRMHDLYKVDISETKIGGIGVRVISPSGDVAAKNKDRVLINLHGGAFYQGENVEALIESIPVASVAGMKVVAVDYRQGPEYKFPAATVDAVAVYREILKSTKANNIGIYGCSAGGSLTAMVTAALIQEKLPLPGGIGIFSSGAFGDFIGDPQEKGTWGGDSRYWAPLLYGRAKLPIKKSEQEVVPFTRDYLSDVDVSDPLVSPAESPDLLAKFPPTLLLTGTRSYDMSATVETRRQLIKNGVEADLHVWDGLGHCFIFTPDLPDAKEAYDVIGKFFNSRLGRGARRAKWEGR